MVYPMSPVSGRLRAGNGAVGVALASYGAKDDLCALGNSLEIDESLSYGPPERNERHGEMGSGSDGAGKV